MEPLTPQMLDVGSKFLQQHSGANDSIFVFPYQTMFGLTSRRNVAGGLMQAYTASGPDLVRIEMSGLEGKPIPAALYMPDADLSHWSKQETQSWSRNYLSIPVDGIPNFTRIPEVWFWMVRHYRTSEQLMPGVVGLVRDDSRASRIALQSQSIGLPQKDIRDQRARVGHRYRHAELAVGIRLPALAAEGALQPVVEAAQARAPAAGDQPRRRIARPAVGGTAAEHLDGDLVLSVGCSRSGRLLQCRR